jgi:RNA polymerase sigma-70 factor (ECF subfamily)
MSVPIDDERALIERAQQGDREAFESLLGGYYDAIYRIAYRWCGNKADAEDVTQNACVKLAKSIDGFRFQSAFLTWVHTLVINTAKDWSKARGRPTVEIDEDLDRAQAPEGEDKVYANQVMTHVRNLPDREKEALLLVFVEGLTHGETAAVMNCKESTVSWYIHEARKKLQSLLQLERRHG